MSENEKQKGLKFDGGKPRMGLVLGGFAKALMAVGDVGTFGAIKYTDNGWQSVENGIQRYTDALLRHLFKHQTGEVLDDESGFPHLSHVAWNALAILSLYLEENDINELANFYGPGDIVQVNVDSSDFRPIKK